MESVSIVKTLLIFQNVVHYKAKGNITVTYIVITATFDLEFEFDAP